MKSRHEHDVTRSAVEHYKLDTQHFLDRITKEDIEGGLDIKGYMEKLRVQHCEEIAEYLVMNGIGRMRNDWDALKQEHVISTTFVVGEPSDA